MLKPPASALPGVTDTLDFVKNLWGSMSIPGATGTGMPGMPGLPGMGGMASPALSTEELDKRITDLKAVEAWLNMNLTMLRGTIQALEVQRGTLAALKSMGDSMAEAMRQSGADKMPVNPFAAFFAPPGQPAAHKPADAAAASKPSAGDDAGQPGASPAGAASGAGADAGAAMQAAMGWWNQMQDQFRQAVATAMTPAAPVTPAASAKDTGATSAPAPAPASSTDADADAGNDGGIGGKPRTPRSKADKA